MALHFIMNSNRKADPYDRSFFDRLTESSYQSAKVIVPLVMKLAPVTSVVDFGCGRGPWLKAFQENGVASIQGYDGSYVEQDKLIIDARHFAEMDLRRPASLTGRYDLAVCLEVAEHLPEKAAPALVKMLTGIAPLVLFSAAIPDQGGTEHINEQWPAYWQELFSARGYSRLDPIRPSIWRDERVCMWYRQNIFLFASAEAIAASPKLQEEKRLHDTNPFELISSPTFARYTYLTGLLSALPSAARRAIRRRARWS